MVSRKRQQTGAGWFAANAKALVLRFLAASAGALFLHRSAQQNPFLHGDAVYWKGFLTGVNQTDIYFAAI